MNQAEIKNKNKAIVSPASKMMVKQPLITEKAYRLSQDGQYIFLVDAKANKSEVKKAVKEIYKVDPISVNMITIKEKSTRFGSKVTKSGKIKKAIVTLKKGQKLDIMPH